MSNADIIELLASHRTLGSAPKEELAWLAARGTLKRFGVGDVMSQMAEPLENLYVVFSGHLAIYVDRGGARKKVMEWRAGDVTGILPYSRMKHPPGTSVVEETADVLTVPAKHFPELIRECPYLTATLVHVMLDRARTFNSSDLHDEKMVSLGKLAAGLAHELNNPASAASRSAALLADGLAEADAAARALGAVGLNASQLAAIDRVRELCVTSTTTASRTPIERADREDAIGEWLDEHGADVGGASALGETAVTIEGLDALAASLEGRALDAALRWIAAGCATRQLAMEIERASSRIYHLVSAVKGFTFMDRAVVPEPVEIGRGLMDTLAVLGSKARTKSASVTMELESDLPRVRGFGGELNQVWANLLDNALDAVGEGGHVSVIAKREQGVVAISVIDDGPGIPTDIMERIFDPFFTTKPVGSGTGLGLDIVRRMLRRIDGNVYAESRPGRTEFKVTLPAVEAPVLEATGSPQ